MDFRSITFDTSVLCRPFDRRFIMAAWELLGAPVPVLPRVAKELYHVMADNEEDHWISVLSGQERRKGITYSYEQKNKIASSVATATYAWVNSKIDHAQFSSAHPCALKQVSMTEQDEGRVRDIAFRIPSRCFRGPSRNNHRGDRLVIAEALVTQHRVLASKNRISIRREPTNQWLKSEFGINDDLVQEADDVVFRTFQHHGHDPDTFGLQSVLLACLPDKQVSPERMDEIVQRFTAMLSKSSFPDCAEGANQCWESEQGLACVNTVRSLLSESVARKTEASRVALVREHAQQAGWQRD